MVKLKDLYFPLANRWEVFDNTDMRLLPIAAGGRTLPMTNYAEAAWRRVLKGGEE